MGLHSTDGKSLATLEAQAEGTAPVHGVLRCGPPPPSREWTSGSSLPTASFPLGLDYVFLKSLGLSHGLADGNEVGLQ